MRRPRRLQPESFLRLLVRRVRVLPVKTLHGLQGGSTYVNDKGLFMPKPLAPLLLCACLICCSGMAAQSPTAANFHKKIRPILETYCFDCHADGANKGNVAFDGKIEQELVDNRELWSRALRMVRAGLMPPAKKSKPTAEQREQLVEWVKRDVFQINPKDPDP